MVNTFSRSLARQRGVDRILPSWLEPRNGVRSATTSAGDGVEPLCFFAEHAFCIDGTYRHKKVCVVVPVVAIMRRCVQRAIHANAELVGNLACIAKCQLGAFIGVKFNGKRQYDFAREHSIAPTVMHFDAVPELRPIVHVPTAWQLNARIEHTVSTTVVEDQAGALIADQRTGSMCGGDRRGAVASASDGRARSNEK